MTPGSHPARGKDATLRPKVLGLGRRRRRREEREGPPEVPSGEGVQVMSVVQEPQTTQNDIEAKVTSLGARETDNRPDPPGQRRVHHFEGIAAVGAFRR